MKSKRTRNLGCGTLILGAIALCAIVFLIPRLIGTETTDVNEPQSVPQDEPVSDEGGNTGDVFLGDLVVTNAVDRDGCPTDDVSTLRDTDAFYVVAPNSELAANTDIFARLYRDNTAIEDVPIITADRDYQNTCINFIFEQLDGNFEPGDYEVEFWVNGNAYDSVSFRIQ